MKNELLNSVYKLGTDKSIRHLKVLTVAVIGWNEEDYLIVFFIVLVALQPSSLST